MATKTRLTQRKRVVRKSRKGERKRTPVLKSPLNDVQIAIVKGMLARGDHQHDIAALFRVNQGRINEIAKGYAGARIAASTDLPVKVEPAYQWPGGSRTTADQPAAPTLDEAQRMLKDPVPRGYVAEKRPDGGIDLVRKDPAPPPASFTTGEISPMPAHLTPKDLGSGAVNWIRDEAGKVETAIAGTSLWQRIKAKLPSGGTWIFIGILILAAGIIALAVLT